MPDILLTRITLLVALLLAGDGLIAASAGEPDIVSSPRLAALAKELKAGNRRAIADFWKEMQGTAPLVETIAEDKKRSRVTFLWRGDDKTMRVSVLGGLPSANLAKPLKHLADSDVWYLTEVPATETWIAPISSQISWRTS